MKTLIELDVLVTSHKTTKNPFLAFFIPFKKIFIYVDAEVVLREKKDKNFQKYSSLLIFWNLVNTFW